MESQQLQREFPASEIANEFVNQYYCVLNNCPDKIYQFYKDCSTITRPEPNGQLVHVETLEAMKNKIVSMLNEGIEVKIGSVDSQEAFNESYIILVTGVILGHDNVERKFAQSFLLAPQERGYFVLNDAFRYLEESQYSEEKTLLVNDVCDEPLQEEIVPAKKIQGFESQPSKLENKHATETVEKTTSPPEETRKMSFLSVLLKENPHPIQMPTVVVKFPINTGLKANVPSQSSNSNSTVRSRKAPVNENSIHLRNLPWNSTITLLEEEFKKYGSIKPGGIQIRANKEKNFCYGFIEFQSSTSVDSAIKTSPIVISGRRVYVEKKRLAGLRDCLIEVALPYSKAKKDGVGDNFSPIEVELSATMQIGRYWRMVGVVLFLDYWGYRGDLSLGYLGYGGLPKPFSPAKRNGFFLSCWTLF
ncbi:nuclear transport factor 2-like [Cryptomeria japonica]|uniref:nuclear transport factor 2-like n=1 Tax=Cryptomeria japonica TaxID=3369 RepID=UPI0027DA5E0E|nr:nuclear transport factor 2-like [Cryptomeria japonica]